MPREIRVIGEIGAIYWIYIHGVQKIPRNSGIVELVVEDVMVRDSTPRETSARFVSTSDVRMLINQSSHFSLSLRKSVLIFHIYTKVDSIL